MHNESVILKKEGKLAVCNNMDEPGGHCAKWDSRKEEDQYYMASLMCGTLKKSHTQRMGCCHELRVGEMGRGCEEVITFSYK